ncbi:FAD-dependent thymidylate synthase [candidate division WOR-3 bacterium]|nr:FAD-dependent thymidylate synthase [candidate division WOR-3 bacterium]
MKVTLAGYNVERELLERACRRGADAPTPETIAAAYARVSRSTKPAEELRREARGEVERARVSNRTIVFDMGHHSIAEHAVFNFDVLDVSRLAVEAVEHHRLAAFTEKSQRYVQLSDQHVVPAELQESDLLGEYQAVIRAQNRYYHELQDKLVDHFRAERPELAGQPQQLDVLAREDARYVTSLATQTQLGMTVNARNLELMLRRFAASELGETRALGEALYEQAAAVAPSLLVFTGPTDYDRRTYPRLREYASGFMAPAFTRRPRNFIAMSASDVTLVDYSQNSDNKLLAAILHTCSRASYAECLARAERQTLARKREIAKLVWQDMQAYDAVLREFEHLYLTFELTISASCFAQLKRHRLATLTVQPYNPNLGWTIPNSIAEVKEHRAFKEMLARTEEVYDRIAATSPAVAQYVLTNSHQRRALVTLDARELYHVARLREDAAAQWDIRDIVSRMVEQARNVMPLTLTLASGKDGYAKVYQELYGHPPAVEKLELPRARPIAVSSRAAPKRRGRKAGS